MRGWLVFCDVPDIRDLDFIFRVFFFTPGVSIFGLCLDEVKMTKDPVTIAEKCLMSSEGLI